MAELHHSKRLACLGYQNQPSLGLYELAIPRTALPVSKLHSKFSTLILLSLSHQWLEPFIICTSQMTWAVLQVMPQMPHLALSPWASVSLLLKRKLLVFC